MTITLALPDADIRGYYRHLGIQLPDKANLEASVRCFADPGAHRREDRDPSCSINLINGAWHCHGCGARGGAYDAALAKGHTPRSAIDLMIAHGLIERRARLQTARELLHTPSHPPASLARTRARNDPARTPGSARNRSRHRPLASSALPPPRPTRPPRRRARLALPNHARARTRHRPRPDHHPDPQRPP